MTESDYLVQRWTDSDTDSDPGKILTSNSDSDTRFLRTSDSDMDSDKFMTSDTGLSENLRHGLGHGQTSGTLVRSTLFWNVFNDKQIRWFWSKIVWENFTNKYPGKFLLTSGKFLLTSGKFLLTSGKFLLTSGKSLLTSGKPHVLAKSYRSDKIDH